MAEPAISIRHSIYQRMAAIVAELPAVGKDSYNEAQKFKYRGHDDAMNALKPLLGKHGVFFVPDVLKRITEQRTTKHGTVMYEVNLHVQYTFYGADGDYVTASAWGEGTDSGDKATNKAMTMALKNVVAQTFALATAETAAYDTDGSTDPDTVKNPAQGTPAPGRRAKKPEAKKAVSSPAAGTERDNEDVPESWKQFASKEDRQRLFDVKNELGVSDSRLQEILEEITHQRTTSAIPEELFGRVFEAVENEAVPFG